MDDLYGPALPPGYVRPDDSDDSTSEPEYTAKSRQSSKFIGPQCPSSLSKNRSERTSKAEQLESSDVIGPVLPGLFPSRENEMSSEDEIMGPMPSESLADSGDLSDRKAEIEKRSRKMKDQLDNKHIPIVKAAEREEWMTVPDTSRRNQLSAISQCLAPSKPSSSHEKHRHKNAEKDKRTSEELKKYNKSKRSESLLDIHKKDRKRKAKEEEKEGKTSKKERKAFDRDEVAVRHFTSDQVNSVIDKAKYLNKRFAAGNQQYL